MTLLAHKAQFRAAAANTVEELSTRWERPQQTTELAASRLRRAFGGTRARQLEPQELCELCLESHQDHLLELGRAP